jgi:hypothetical protein
MPYCTSCGSEIPEDQGHSCSMCYGDISWGRDGYYQEWAEEQQRQFEERECEDAMWQEYQESLYRDVT